jgi:hypothetical protein
MLGLHSHKPYPTQTATRKRTHLKPSQVAVLQESFVTNTLPDATIRSQLALELGVTERTVQIWFQNRRAKARKLEAMSNSTPGGMSCLVPNVRTGWIEMPQHSIYQQQQNSHHHQQQPQNQQQHHHHQQQQQQLQQQQQQLQQHDQNNFRALMTPEYYEQPTQAIKRRPRSSSKPEKVSLDLLPPTAPQRAMSEGIAKDDLSQGKILSFFFFFLLFLFFLFVLCMLFH